MSKITKAGVYDIPIEQYHSDCCDGPSVSASGLSTIINECPAIFWESTYLNPNAVPDRSTHAFDVGRAAHSLVLGEPEFAKYFAISPFDDFRTKEARAWRDAETRTVLKAKDFEAISDMAAAQKRSPQVANAFRDGRPEMSLIWRDEETGVWVKSRPDWLPNEPTREFAIDYKSCRSIKPRVLGAAVFDYGYHCQAAMIVDAIEIVLGVKPLGVAHVVQEKDRPYLAELRMFSPEQLDFGRLEYRRALRIFAECWERHLAGKPERIAWPGYTANPDYFLTPYHISKAMEESEHEPTRTDRRENRAVKPTAADLDAGRRFYEPV